ncbi:piggyBac transposable element-derived protein 4-like, partial [Anthonomus grandis grandis]|uniref:piggyBac transposable element-derived protein 4-like n=1 Tax=Anthonomus grandis grandis TaxID=2921223 RepID=UPI0021650E2C
MQIYAGKNLELTKTTPTNVVMNPCQPILNCVRTVVTDNWYTNVELASKLLEKETHLLGTLKKKRKGLPREVVDKKLKIGEHLIRENAQGISVLKWRDKRDVLLLSTKHSDSMVFTQNRMGNFKHKPQMVVEYNAGKSAADLSDQLTAYQSPLRKSLKWYRKFAFKIILNTALVNAWIIYKQVTKENMPIVDFCKRITYKLRESFLIIMLNLTHKESENDTKLELFRTRGDHVPNVTKRRRNGLNFPMMNRHLRPEEY